MHISLEDELVQQLDERIGVLLDTTVLIDLLRGRQRTAERIRLLRSHGDTLYTCAVNVEEVARGLKPREAPAADALFRALRIAPLGRAEGRAGRDVAQRFLGSRPAALAGGLPDRGGGGRRGSPARDGEPEGLPHAGSGVDRWPPER
jgi:PIN domain